MAAAAVALVIAAGCGSGGGLTPASTCEDLNNAGQADATRFVRDQLEAAGGAPSNDDVIGAMGTVSYLCAGDPDQELGTLPFDRIVDYNS